MLESAPAIGSPVRGSDVDRTQVVLERAWRDLSALGLAALEALVVAVATYLVGRVARRWVDGILLRTRVDRNVAALAGNAVVVAVYVVGATVALSLFGGNWTTVVAALGAATVAVTLALQDILRSFVCGVYLLVERPFAIGDRIRVGEQEGVVRAIEFRTTVLETDTGERVMVPNATVFAGVVTNLSTADHTLLKVEFAHVAEDPSQFDAALAGATADWTGRVVGEPVVSLRAATSHGLTYDVAFPVAPRSDATPLLAALHAAFPAAAIRLADA